MELMPKCTLQALTQAITAIDFDPLNECLLAADSEGNLTLFDLTTGKIIRQWQVSRPFIHIHSIAYQPGGSLVAVAVWERTSSGRIEVLNTEDWSVSYRLSTTITGDVIWSNDGHSLGVPCGRARIFDAASGELASEIKHNFVDNVVCMAFSPSGKQFACAARAVDTTVVIADTLTGEKFVPNTYDQSLREMGSDAPLLLRWMSEHELVLLDQYGVQYWNGLRQHVDNWIVAQSRSGFDLPVTLSFDGKLLAYISYTSPRAIHLVTLPEKIAVATAVSDQKNIQRLQFKRDRTLLASADAVGSINVYMLT